MNRQPVTVSKLTAYIKGIIESSEELRDVYVRGEISNFKYHSSGHMYFTLKDENAKIKCVMFKGSNIFLKFTPEDGMNVIIQGYISLYERDGQYQMYCTKMEPDGVGSLYLAFEQLKSRLQREGLFEEERKKPIPVLPERIGVATSPTGAVIRDIINVSSKRFYNSSILLYPVKVQGEGAAATIVEAIEYFNTRDDIDVIIIGRGGGSIEELWAFNEEIVAKAIYKSRIPVISAVGHETDFTIADFVADMRASTPSHAAEIAVPSYEGLMYKLENLLSSLRKGVNNNISQKSYYLEGMVQNIKSNSPQNRIIQQTQYIDNLQNKMSFFIQKGLSENKGKFSILSGKLDSLSPLKILCRGYAYVEKDAILVKSIGQLNKNDDIKLHMQDGTIDCKVTEIVEGSLWRKEIKK